jgi:hypothetical protein
LSPTVTKKWEKWAADADNRAECKALLRMEQILSAYPRPPLPSDAELLADSVELIEREKREIKRCRRSRSAS